MRTSHTLIHGDSRRGKTLPEYNTWRHMKSRCYNPNNEEYKNYGGRGIQVYSEWQFYEAFIADMGRKPTPKHSLGRINNNGDYTPNNCEWQLPIQQGRNSRRVKLTLTKAIEIRKLYQLTGMTHRELAKKFNVSRSAIHKVLLRTTWK